LDLVEIVNVVIFSELGNKYNKNIRNILLL